MSELARIIKPGKWEKNVISIVKEKVVSKIIVSQEYANERLMMFCLIEKLLLTKSDKMRYF